MSGGLGVSIVTYNTDLEELKKVVSKLCLEQLVIGICLIDNTPNKYYTLKNFAKMPQSEKINIIYNISNTGYVAHNLGIGYFSNLGCNYHLVLNADVSFDGGILNKLLNVMEDNTNIGLLMPKVLNSNGTLQRIAKVLPSPFTFFLRMIGMGAFRFLDISTPSESSKAIFVPYLSGCFMLMRMKILEKISGMDERFFMYAEDIDLSRRIAAICDTVYYPKVHIYHKHGASSKKSVPMFFIHLKNVVMYFAKWGWLIDHERKRLNKRCGEEIKLKISTKIR